VTFKARNNMGRHKRKPTTAERAAKRRRKRETMIIFVNGRQKRVKREPTIEGMSVDEFIRRNADPIWLHQNEMWEYMQPEESDCGQGRANSGRPAHSGDSDTIDDIPF
jgi:hypothetical protein